MVVCKFWTSGSCKFGDKCRFEHPGAGQQQQQPRNNFGPSGGHSQQRNNLQNNQAFASNNRPNNARNAQNQNSFGSLESRIETPSGPRGNPRFGGNYVPPNQAQTVPNHRGRGFQGNKGGRRGPARPNNYELHPQALREELLERPQWPLTCFGPGKNPPINLWGGDIEQSPEELRELHYLDLEQGVPPRSAQIESEGASQAAQFANNAMEDLDGAIDYIISGESQPDNRLAITKFVRHQYPLFSQDNYRRRQGAFKEVPRDQSRRTNGTTGGFQSNNGFQAQSAGTGFGQPSSGFSQPPPNGFGQPQNNGLGSAGVLGQQNQSSFGQPSSGFGAIGQGAPTQDMPMDAPMGSPSQSGFGQAAQSPGTNPFGNNNPSFQTNANAFNVNQAQANLGFAAQPSNPQMQQGAFGVQAQPFGAQQQPSAGGLAQQPNGFGGPLQHSANTGFGQQQPGVFGNGPSQITSGAAGPPLQPGSESEQAWLYMRQNGTFKDGIMPESAPPEDFIT